MSIPIDKDHHKEPIRPDKGPHKSHVVAHLQKNDTLEFGKSMVKSFNLVPDTPVLARVDSFTEVFLTEADSEIAPETRKIIQTHIESLKSEGSEVLEIKQFYPLMAKLFPIATSFLRQINLKEKSAAVEKLKISLKRMVEEIKEHPEYNQTPKDIIVTTLRTVEAFPEAQKPEVMMLLMASNVIDLEGFFGKSLTGLKEGITEIVMVISEKMKIIPYEKRIEAKHYLSSAIGQFLLAGILMGKTLALKPNGKVKQADELKQLLLEDKQEIKIFDLIPFSFLAFFVPFIDMREGSSKPVKNSLLHFIRLMLRLVFALLAIQTGGAKLGNVNLLLKENTSYLIQIISELVVAMKKLNEGYGVNTKFQIKYAEVARESLAVGKYPEFWFHVLQIFSKESDLHAFLKETQDADPLYEAIHSLVNIGSTSINLQSHG